MCLLRSSQMKFPVLAWPMFLVIWERQICWCSFICLSQIFTGHISRFLFDSDGRVLSALVLLGPMSLNVVNIYAPNTVSERKTFFEHLHDYFLPNGSRVIAGDFNCIDSKLDRHSTNTLLPDKKCHRCLAQIESARCFFHLV